MGTVTNNKTMSFILSCFGIGSKKMNYKDMNTVISSANEGDDLEDSDTENVCWICLCVKNDKNETLIKPCKCVGDMYVHASCLSKWQVHNIGKEEETTCRFCKEALPDWKNNFVVKTNRIITLSVCTPSAVIQIQIDPIKTPDFQTEFKRIITEEYGISSQHAKITFTTKLNNTEITNNGLDNINKMIHLARYNAENRIPVASMR